MLLNILRFQAEFSNFGPRRSSDIHDLADKGNFSKVRPKQIFSSRFEIKIDVVLRDSIAGVGKYSKSVLAWCKAERLVASRRNAVYLLDDYVSLAFRKVFYEVREIAFDTSSILTSVVLVCRRAPGKRGKQSNG